MNNEYVREVEATNVNVKITTILQVSLIDSLYVVIAVGLVSYPMPL